jgi:hypothetical protein
MRADSRSMRVWLVIGSAVLLATCDSSPTGPSERIGPIPVYDVSIEITGPSSIPPDQTAQFTAIVRRSDGTTRDATNEAQWFSSAQGVLTISPTGMATARLRGETRLNARSGSLGGSKTVFVLPDGTFRLSVTVTDSGFGVSGARVEVTGGPAAGLVAVATFGLDRAYQLYGVSGDTPIRATKDGYQPTDVRVMVTDNQTLNVELTPTRREDVSGTYTLTITAAALACRDRLPEEARTRTYTAVLTQDGANVEATLSGAKFVVNASGKGNRFRGRVLPGQLLFELTPYDDYYYSFWGADPDVVEELTNGYLVLAGIARLSIAPGRLSGRLNGSIGTYPDNPPNPRSVTSICIDSYGDGHQVEFSR